MEFNFFFQYIGTYSRWTGTIFESKYIRLLSPPWHA